MSFVNLAERTTSDLNAAADINTLMANINYTLAAIYGEIIREIELLKVTSALCDPLNISSKYLIADGSTIPSDSEAYIIHNTGGTITKDSFSASYTGKGLTRIPNLLGQHPRYAALGSTNDPDRADRRQAVTGTVDTTSGTIVYLPKYYINLIKHAVDNSRTIIIGQAPATIFDTLTVYGTISSVNTSLNYVVLTSITGTFTAGTGKSLIIKGDVIGSLQADAYQEHYHTLRDTGGAGSWTVNSSNVAMTTNPGYYGNQTFGSLNGGYGTPRIGYETRGKNIALLPLVRVYL